MTDLTRILELHARWLKHQNDGKCADFSGAFLCGARFRDQDLRYADFTGADLSNADFRRSNLRSACFSGAYLDTAVFIRTDLQSANFSKANLFQADLLDANLKEADLFQANLERTDLWGCVGNQEEIKTAQIDTYDIAYTATRLQIGCENHGIEDWWGFDDKTIRSMDGHGAVEWWRCWKPLLRQIIETSPAKPTGAEK